MANAVGTVVDGVLQENKDPNAKKKELPKGSNLGYEEFLQLLCAEMQYQDPLEPTSNTEYVAQLATFSQVEALLAMQETQKSVMANDLVGKTVILKIENETTGKENLVDGRVDYVLYKDGETLLSVNGKEYPLSSLDTVVDNDYYEALGLAKSIQNMLEYLPDIDNVRPEHEKMIKQIGELYDSMTDYQKQFVDDETFQKLVDYRTRLEEVLKLQQEAEGKDDNIV